LLQAPTDARQLCLAGILFSDLPAMKHPGAPRPALAQPHIYWTLEGTKADKHRTVQLVPQAVAALVCHRERQGVERVVAGDGCADYDFVFAGPSGGPLRADLVSKQFARAAGTAGMRPMRLYDARHTCATLLLEAGEPLKVV
jgi:integrase